MKNNSLNLMSCQRSDSRNYSLAQLSFAMHEAFEQCGSIDAVAETLNLPPHFVMERVEAARLCLIQLQ